MYIKYLQLKDYRNYESLSIDLNNKVNVFIGDNAHGKTNILESIYYCSLGKSHRTNKDKDLINWNKQDAYVNLYVVKNRLDKKIEIKIFKDGKKGIKINSIKINKISELVGAFNVVLFSPEDLKIVKESPSNRRKFLDIELCKLDSKYYYSLVQYNKALDERNMLLKHWKEDSKNIIEIYNEQMSRFGSYIVMERIKYINKLNVYGKNIHREISSGTEEIDFKYLTTLKNLENLQIDFKELLSKNLKSDIEKRTTTNGPHRDDFSIIINGVDARNFGSQGQQRTSILTIKFSSLEIIKETTSEYPVLLLDDVLSELDVHRQKYILSSINNVQTIITCTGIENIKAYLSENAKVFDVEKGNISREYELNTLT